MEAKQISIDQIDEPSYDVRSWISREALDEMAESVAAVGILLPIRVFEKNGRYEIEDGHRRFLAAQMAGLQIVPCIIVEDQESKREIYKLHANVHSEHISPIEKSRTLHHVKEKFGYTNEELARLMGLSLSRISQLLGLLSMDPKLVEAMEAKHISEAAARLLQQVPDPERRVYYIQYIREGGATLDTIRSWVAQEKVWAEAPAPAPELEEGRRPDIEIDYPTMRCAACRNHVRSDAMHLLRVCPDCFQEVNQVLPAVYEAMKIERQPGPVEPGSEDGPTVQG